MIQIIIGISVVTTLMIALTIFRRKKRAVWGGISVCFAVVLAVTIGFTVAETEPIDLNTGLYFGEESDRVRKNSKSEYEVDKSGYIDVIRYLMNKGELDDAQQLLKEYGENAEYDSDYMCLVADVYDAVGNSERADTIRNSLKSTSFEINESKRKKNDKAEISAKAYYAVRELSKGTDSYGSYSGELDESELYEYMRDWLNAGFPYSELPSMNRALLAIELYLHDYANIANEVMSEPDGDTLIVASQLIRNGKIDDDDVTDDHLSLSAKADEREVLDHIKDERQKENIYTEEDKKLLDEKIETLENALNGDIDILYDRVVDMMKMKSEKSDESSAKICLELADIAYDSGDNASAAKYVEKGLSYASQSSDTEFSSIVERINEIILNSDDPEERKLLSDYVNQMVRNRMPEDIPPIDTTVLDNAAEIYEEENRKDDSGHKSDKDHESYILDKDNSENDEYEEYEEDDMDTDTDTGRKTDEKSLTQNINDTINQISGSINIVSINTKNFPSVSAVVAADENYASSAEEFKTNMKVTDAEIDIADYEVEKIDYDTINIVLVCDDSGSMDANPRDCLSDAIKTFAKKADEKVKIGIVPFSSGVKTDMVSALGASKSELTATADALRADGGTNIFDAVTYANTLFPDNENDLNIMILMSDGNDGLPSVEDLDMLKTTCVNRGITIYTVGLGSSVDAGLLEEYAVYGSGEYFYVNTPESIESFYNFIYNISKNRYRVKYNAVDTYLIDRRLEVRYNKSESIYGEQYYSLFSNDLDGKLSDDISITVNNVVINGLREKMVYYADYSQELTLCGDGFESNAEISVELHGASAYSCEVEYKDPNTAKVTVPGKVPVGLYDVYVTYNGKRAVFASGFIVTSGDTNVVRFGEYVFTASSVERSDDYVKLSGVVQLNGWLGFSDAVTLTGNLEEDYNISMKYGKTYMQYTDASKGGLPGYFAKKGYTTSLPANGEVTLYNDTSVKGSSDDYPVENLPVYDMRIIDFLKVDEAGVAIYPDRAVVDFNAFTTKLPFQDKVLTAVGYEKPFKFELDHKEKLIFSKDKIDCNIEVKIEGDDDDKKSGFKLGNSYLGLGEFEIKVNTLKGNFKLKATAKIANVIDNLGFELGVEEWKLEKIMIIADKDITASIEGVNVTFDNFKLGVDNLSKVDFSKGWTSIFNAELVGSCNISLMKLSSYCPGIEKFIGEELGKTSVVSFEDVTLGLRLKEFRIRAETKTKFLGLMDVGNTKFQLGCGLEYDNPLFVLQDEPNGFIGEAGIGPKIDTDNLKLNIGAALNLALTDQVIGIWGSGDFEVKISWWVFVSDTKARGDIFGGFYKQHNGKMAFAIIGSGSSSGGKNVNFSVVCGEKDSVLSSHKF